jgi:hypothetical protein
MFLSLLRHLPKLYKTILDERPKIDSWLLAEAVAKGTEKVSGDGKGVRTLIIS